MSGRKVLAVSILLLTAAVLLTGCSASGALGRLLGETAETQPITTAVSAEEGQKLDSKIVDPSVEKPVFQEGLVREKHAQAGAEVTLETAAAVNDGGTVTYQWYSNNVNSNGGGTMLPGAVDSTYKPDTSKGGTTFYYVMATNTRNDHVNLSTSDVYQVTVWEDMYWQQNADLRAYQYISRVDGKYPKAVSMVIDGTEYHFDADGFAVNTEGAYIDVQTGEVLVTATPVPEETPAPETEPADDAAQAESTAETQTEEAPAEEAPAEEAPAEEAPAEEAPAE